MITRGSQFGVGKAKVEHNQVLRKGGRFKPKNHKLNHGSSFFAIRGWEMWSIDRKSPFGVEKAGFEGV